jgi:hypothetical protein
MQQVFFTLLSGLTNDAVDEEVGDVDCYVITGESKGETKTLWIGKEDYLIRQIRTMVSTAALRVAVAKWIPEETPDLPGFTWTEMHTNIIVNKRFVRTEFLPSFPGRGFSDPE